MCNICRMIPFEGLCLSKVNDCHCECVQNRHFFNGYSFLCLDCGHLHTEERKGRF